MKRIELGPQNEPIEVEDGREPQSTRWPDARIEREVDEAVKSVRKPRQ